MLLPNNRPNQAAAVNAPVASRFQVEHPRRRVTEQLPFDYSMTREFQEITEAFRSDGALRDFYIQDTSKADWNVVLRRVRRMLRAGCFTVDGEDRELPTTFEEIERIHAEECPCLNIPVAGAYVCCHFFCAEEIEFDFRPEDYRTPEAWSALSEFLQDIVDTVAKPGIVTYENAPDDVIERFEPKRRVEPCAAPNGGPTASVDNSNAPGGPPSVS